MKFLTLEMYDALSETFGPEPLQEASKLYRRHLDEIRDKLPVSVRQLAALQDLGDSLVSQLVVDRAGRSLRLVLRSGDLQVGYYNLELSYEGVTMLPEHAATLAKIAQGTKDQSRFGNDLSFLEIDLAEDGRIEHRFIFHGNTEDRVWFAIRCDSLRWRKVPRESRRLSPYRDRYIER